MSVHSVLKFWRANTDFQSFCCFLKNGQKMAGIKGRDGLVMNDGSWTLTVFVTDLQVERSLRVRGDLHIGGVMISLVDELGKTRNLLFWKQIYYLCKIVVLNRIKCRWISDRWYYDRFPPYKERSGMYSNLLVDRYFSHCCLEHA